MSRVDQELLREVTGKPSQPLSGAGSSSAVAGQVAGPTNAEVFSVEVSSRGATSPDPSLSVRSRAGWGLLGVLLAMGGGLTALILMSSPNAAVYSVGVDQLVAERDQLVGRLLRAEGTLVKGSLVKRDQPCEYRFALERGGVRLPVHFPQCSLPDTFRDVPYSDVSVTAEGQIQGDHFQATSILAKCPSKYEEKQHGLGLPPGAADPAAPH